jgi:hypothetical protein
VNAKERERSTHETCHVIQKRVADFLSTTCIPSSSHRDNQTKMKWSRPMLNVVKVNFDAAFLDNIKAGGEWIQCSPRYLHTPFQIFIQNILTHF